MLHWKVVWKSHGSDGDGFPHCLGEKQANTGDGVWPSAGSAWEQRYQMKYNTQMLHGTGIFAYIYHCFKPNVGKYTMHGAYVGYILWTYYTYVPGFVALFWDLWDVWYAFLSSRLFTKMSWCSPKKCDALVSERVKQQNLSPLSRDVCIGSPRSTEWALGFFVADTVDG